MKSNLEVSTPSSNVTLREGIADPSANPLMVSVPPEFEAPLKRLDWAARLLPKDVSNVLSPFESITALTLLPPGTVIVTLSPTDRLRLLKSMAEVLGEAGVTDFAMISA